MLFAIFALLGLQLLTPNMLNTGSWEYEVCGWHCR